MSDDGGQATSDDDGRASDDDEGGHGASYAPPWVWFALGLGFGLLCIWFLFCSVFGFFFFFDKHLCIAVLGNGVWFAFALYRV